MLRGKLGKQWSGGCWRGRDKKGQGLEAEMCVVFGGVNRTRTEGNEFGGEGKQMTKKPSLAHAHEDSDSYPRGREEKW